MKLYHYILLGCFSIAGVACGASRKHATHEIPAAGNMVTKNLDAELTKRLGMPVPVSANANLVNELSEWIGVPYKYGGNTKSGTDCSGLICNVLPKVYKVQMPRSTAQMYQARMPVEKAELKEGDIVFFTIDTKLPGHSGIYLWDGYFAHASSSKGVIISHLSENYWNRYFVGAGRFSTPKPGTPSE